MKKIPAQKIIALSLSLLICPVYAGKKSKASAAEAAAMATVKALQPASKTLEPAVEAALHQRCTNSDCQAFYDKNRGDKPLKKGLCDVCRHVVLPLPVDHIPPATLYLTPQQAAAFQTNKLRAQSAYLAKKLAANTRKLRFVENNAQAAATRYAQQITKLKAEGEDLAAREQALSKQLSKTVPPQSPTPTSWWPFGSSTPAPATTVAAATNK